MIKYILLGIEIILPPVISATSPKVGVLSIDNKIY